MRNLEFRFDEDLAGRWNEAWSCALSRRATDPERFRDLLSILYHVRVSTSLSRHFADEGLFK